LAENEDKGFGFITPRGVFVYPKLHKADTKFKPEGEYSTKVRLPGDAEGYIVGSEKWNRQQIEERLQADLDKFVEAKRNELANSKDPKQKKKARELKVREVIEAALDDEGNETSEIIHKAIMKASGVSKKTGKPWQRTPSVFDARGKAIKPVPAIYGGSEGKLAVVARPYYVASDNVCGITLYLEAVQLLKLVKGGDRSAGSYGFGEEEGYTDEADEGGQQFDDSAAGGDANGSEPDDF
jgi:hypothetical protein